MEDLKARQIVDNLLSDLDFYQKMSEKENKLWGKIFSDPKRQKAFQEDREASQNLKLNRDQINLNSLIKKHKLSPKAGLSLACGSGRTERGLITNGVCQKFHGIDISTKALEEARKLAAQKKLNITYEEADLNYISLPANKYDLVVTQTCLHHVLRLEHIADEISQAMTPNGVLWIHDYIGESQFQHSDERLEIVNTILQLLPENMCRSKLNGRLVKKVVRREPGTLASPFECIRSAEIMPIFLERFDVIEKKESNSILHLVCPKGTRAEFAKDEESRKIFELVFLLDKLLLKEGILPPCGGQYLLKKK